VIPRLFRLRWTILVIRQLLFANHFVVSRKSVVRGKPLNCQVKDELVNHLIALNNKLNLLSPDLVQSEEERTAVQEQRGSLYADIKRHRAKGHDGKPCPAARYTRF
jgi:hypothetical protein